MPEIERDPVLADLNSVDELGSTPSCCMPLPCFLSAPFPPTVASDSLLQVCSRAPSDERRWDAIPCWFRGVMDPSSGVLLPDTSRKGAVLALPHPPFSNAPPRETLRPCCPFA